jgi:hypothetical protein
MSDGAVARNSGVNRHTVALCIRKFLQFGLDAALGELPRPGKSRRIPDDAIAWVEHCACQKPKELGYFYELWPYALLQKHVREKCTTAGHPIPESSKPVQTAPDSGARRDWSAQDPLLR